MIFLPEVNLAQRLTARLELHPPVDVAQLVKRYAHLEEARFPVDVDGICLDLKVAGKRPRVIINSNKPENRIRFTLAHELGYILIPWHVGSIVDETDLDEDEFDDYWQIENEANRFASELLMPQTWMEQLLQATSNPLKALSELVQEAVVSVQAATIKMLNMLPPGHLMVQLDNGFVVSSKKSPATLASPPPVGTQIDVDLVFPWTDRWQQEIGGRHYVWWEFRADIAVPIIQTDREWRDILNDIITDLSPPEDLKFKATLNGIIAHANGCVRENRTAGAILDACLQRLYSNAVENFYIEKFLAHDLFDEFMAVRIQSLLKS